MEKEDARKLEKAALYEKRKQVIWLHRSGQKRSDIARLVALSHTAVSKIVKLFELGGLAALKLKRRGRSQGQVRRLTAEQETQIQRLIIDNRPEQIKMDFALWSRTAVSQLIERECGLALPVRTIGEISSDGDSRRKSRSKKPMSNALKRSKNGSTKSIRKLPNVRMLKVEKCIGEMKRHWSIQTSEGAVFRQKERRQFYAPGTRQRLSMIATVTNKGHDWKKTRQRLRCFICPVTARN